MHGPRNIVSELFYGSDGSNLYLRLDFDGAPEFSGVELRTKEMKVALSGNPAVERAQKGIFEARVPFELLKMSNGQPIAFQVALLAAGVPVEQIPPDGWIELSNPSV